MKKIIINKKQLGFINEININVNSSDQSSSGYVKAATDGSTYSDIQKARKVAPDVDVVVSGPKSDDSSLELDIDVPAGSSVQNAINQNPDNQEAISAGAKAKIHGDGFVSEMKLTKKQIEEARIRNIKQTGKHYTKKELEESFKNEKK